jgi:hypothetical protein
MSRLRIIRPLFVAISLAVAIGGGPASAAAPSTATSTLDRGPDRAASAVTAPEPAEDQDVVAGAFSCTVMSMMAGASAELGPD